MTRPSPAQLATIRRQYPTVVLLFAVGEGRHEAYGEDADAVSRCCATPLLAAPTTGDGCPGVARIEEGSLRGCVAALLAAGYRVACCSPVAPLGATGDWGRGGDVAPGAPGAVAPVASGSRARQLPLW